MPEIPVTYKCYHCTSEETLLEECDEEIPSKEVWNVCGECQKGGRKMQKKQRTNKDPYVMTDEKLAYYINMKVPVPFSETFERVQRMTREELIKEWLKYYDTPAVAPVEVK